MIVRAGLFFLSVWATVYVLSFHVGKKNVPVLLRNVLKAGFVSAVAAVLVFLIVLFF